LSQNLCHIFNRLSVHAFCLTGAGTSKLQIMTRAIFIMVDGLGDLNFPANGLDFEDIFSQLNTPNMSKYFFGSDEGFFGLMDPIEPGSACGSDTAHLSLFGINPIK
jgi:2,3-bisphosphoglycerate-independent phosphoglycerate mutase